jgi:hypothetical protein
MRWEAVKAAARTATPGPSPEVTPGPDLRAYAAAADAIARARPAFETLTNLARSPEALFEAVEKGLSVPHDPPDDLISLD